MDTGEDCLVYIIGGAIALFLLYLAVTLAATSVYWVAASFSYWFMTFLAWLSCEALLPNRPEVMWAVWGGLLGAALAWWPLAPIYGLRKYRGALIWSVVFLMVATASYLSFGPGV